VLSEIQIEEQPRHRNHISPFHGRWMLSSGAARSLLHNGMLSFKNVRKYFELNRFVRFGTKVKIGGRFRKCNYFSIFWRANWTIQWNRDLSSIIQEGILCYICNLDTKFFNCCFLKKNCQVWKYIIPCIDQSTINTFLHCYAIKIRKREIFAN